jgi:uncharacterized protein with NRDE domain
MCTLILGRDVVAAGTLLLAANRDEDPARPSDPPAVLHDHPKVVGGRDRRAGGTWLAVREPGAVVAILNRRPGPDALPAERRSRGALTLDVATVADDGRGLAAAALARAVQAVEAAAYAPFTLVFATADNAWMMVHDGDRNAVPREIPSGWHVLTHADLDDVREPRTAWLTRELAGWTPRDRADAEHRLEDLLRSHGDPAHGVPPVCLHAGRMVTVSASMVWLAPGALRYRHAEGRPCEHPFEDAREPRARPAAHLE